MLVRIFYFTIMEAKLHFQWEEGLEDDGGKQQAETEMVEHLHCFLLF